MTAWVCRLLLVQVEPLATTPLSQRPQHASRNTAACHTHTHVDKQARPALLAASLLQSQSMSSSDNNLLTVPWLLLPLTALVHSQSGTCFLIMEWFCARTCQVLHVQFWENMVSLHALHNVFCKYRAYLRNIYTITFSSTRRVQTSNF